MNDNLHDRLNDLLRSDVSSNTALNHLISDYRLYHFVLVLVGGGFLLAVLILGILSWRRFRRSPSAASGGWSFEKWTYLYFSGCAFFVGLVAAVTVAANTSNVVASRQGLADSLSMLGNPAAGTRQHELHQAFTTWLDAGTGDMPALVQSRIDDRLAWQRPKALICTILLVAFAVLATRIWRTLIERSRQAAANGRLKTTALLTAGNATFGCCFLLMLMVLGNTQASFAPLGLTLFNG